MAEVNFIVGSQNAVAKVNESQIRPVNSRFLKGIIIPFSIMFPKITETNDWNNKLNGRWISFDGSLNYAGINEPIFFFSQEVNRDIFENHEIHADLTFEFTNEKLKQIEKLRNGDLVLKLRMHVFLEIQKDYRKRIVSLFSDDPNRENQELSFFTRVDQFHFELNFKIAKSFWIEDILSRIFKPFKLVQLPSGNSIGEGISLDELLKAEEYFLNGDYDKVVAHCRAALDPIRKKYQGLQNWIKSGKLTEDWAEGIKFSTLQWLDSQFKLLADITNKSHHAEPRSFGHFSREDAEAIYLVTSGVISIGERSEFGNSIKE